MSKARVRIPASLARLLREDWEKIILQSNLGVEDTRIATMYLLDAIPQVDIGIELNLTRSTISRRWVRILTKLEEMAKRIYTD